MPRRRKAVFFRSYPADLRDKIRIIWTKYCGSLRGLSPNIIREICTYLGYVATCAKVHDGCAYILDLTSFLWTPLPISHKSRNLLSYGRFIDLSPTQVFLCGGHIANRTCHTDKRHALFLDYDQCVQLPPMIYTRARHGVMYVSRKTAVYVFGGVTDSRNMPLNYAEMFDFGVGEWVELPRMLRAKDNVSLCLSTHFIYMTDFYMSGERFDLLTHTYSLLDFQTPISTYDIHLTVYNNKLCVFHGNSYYQWDLESGRLINRITSTENTYFYIQNAIYVKGNVVYLICETEVLDYGIECADLDTGGVVWRNTLKYAEK